MSHYLYPCAHSLLYFPVFWDNFEASFLDSNSTFDDYLNVQIFLSKAMMIFNAYI